jgi:hypothetical protein
MFKKGDTMIVQNQHITRSVLSMLAISGIVFAGGCSTDSGAKKSAAANPAAETEYLSAADVRKDPDRVICRRHKPTGSRISEKICMTARQWQQASDETQRGLEKAQRTTGGTQAN